MVELQEHPAMGRTYEIIIGGVAYPGQCRTVKGLETGEGRANRYVAVCNYFNKPDATFKLEVDGLGNPV